METDRIVEAKYWRDKKSYETWFKNPKAFNKLINDLKEDKHVMERNRLRKVCLVFCKRVLDDAMFNSYIRKFKDVLGRDTS